MVSRLYLIMANILHVIVGLLAGYIGGDQSVAITIAYIAYQYFEYRRINDTIVWDILVYLASMVAGFIIKAYSLLTL
mgnify:CR=1 FL=1